MCLIAICVEKHLSKEAFETAFTKNDDGVGFAWFNEKNQTCFKKGFMKCDEAFAFSETLPLTHVIHFRAQSIGKICPELTHPFIVSKESPLDLEGETDKNLLFMNGTSAWWEEFLAASGRYREENELFSDARALAMIIAPDNERFLHKVTAKFAIADNKAQKFYYFGDFKNDNGIIFSNDSWKKSPVTFSVKKKTENSGLVLTSGRSGINETISLNYGTNPQTNYSISNKALKPWSKDLDIRHRVLKYLLNKMSAKASYRLWNTYTTKQKGLDWAHARALKVVKQQIKGFNSTRLEKFIQADKMEFAARINFLISNGIKTLNLDQDPSSNLNKDSEQNPS